MEQEEREINTIYLDTGIFSFLHTASTKPEAMLFQSQIREFWLNEKYKYTLYASKSVRFELLKGFYKHKLASLRESFLVNILKRTPEIDSIIDYYIEKKVMPKGKHGDAAHLAFASYYRIDCILTFNFNNLANPNKRTQMEVINRQMGLELPRIISPESLLSKSKE